MNSGVKQNTRAQFGVMLGTWKAPAKMIIKSFWMTMGYLNARIQSRD
jgi:hypothetical protein